MADNYAGRAGGLSAPAGGGFTVTPNDAADLPRETRGIYVGASGDLALVMADGSGLTLCGVPAGTVVPVRATRVKATNTTADLLVGLY